MSSFGPKAHILSVVDEWSPFYIKRTQQVMDGTWKPEDHWGGMAEGEIVIPEFTNIPEEVATEAQAIIDAIKSGSFHPFTGPIKNQAGELKVAEGEILPHGEMAGMSWYIEGVKGDIPK